MAVRPLKLNKDGTLRLLEADVSLQLNDFLRLKGWRCIRLESETVMRLGGFVKPVGEKGQPDWLCIRPIDSGKCDLFFREDKRPKGPKAMEHQIDWHEEARDAGFLICVPHSFDEFREWYSTNFEG